MRTFGADSVLRIENVLGSGHEWDVLAWRNSPEVRRNMLDDTVITREEHAAYLELLKSDGDRKVGILTDRGEPVLVATLNVDREANALRTGWYSVDRSAASPEYPLYVAYLFHDSAFGRFPSCEVGSQVLLGNRRVVSFHKRLGYRISDPYPQELKSGRVVDVVDVRCGKLDWEAGSRRMRGIYERVLAEASSAQAGLVW